MSKSQISKRYAKAAFDLAVQKSNVSDVLNDLTSLVDVVEKDTTVSSFLVSPISSKKDLVSFVLLLKEKLSLQDLTFKVLNVLVENKRLDLLSSVKEEFLSLSRQKDKIVCVDVFSVYKLSESDVNSIKESLQGSLNFEIEVNNIIDQSIIGGLVIKIGSKLIDASLKSSLKRISKKMKEVI